MKIKDYPYGKVTKSLRKAVNYLNRNKIRIYKDFAKHADNWEEYVRFTFDYPDYLDMPKTISHRLNSDQVDWLQSEWADFCDEYDKYKEIQ